MLPAILSLQGHELTANERAFLREANPFGMILFRRNIDNPDQVKRLTDDLRSVMGRDTLPILIDQEGRNVQRMRPPHWEYLPNIRAIGDLYCKDHEKGLRALTLQAQIVSAMLVQIGVDVITSPVMDVPVSNASDVIGVRAFSEDAQIVAELSTHMAQEFLNCGIIPILKHAPGHGRALVDSHFACPHVDASIERLKETDFLPYTYLTKKIDPKNVWAMTAHVVFTAYDDQPVSVSAKSIKILRDELNLSGLIMADTIEMDALGGSIAERALATINAGCDVTLYCRGDLKEMQDIAAILPKISDVATERFNQSIANRLPFCSYDWKEKYQELTALITDPLAYTFQEHYALNVA
jgi:beta-N-acetylhexosaminidase